MDLHAKNRKFRFNPVSGFETGFLAPHQPGCQFSCPDPKFRRAFGTEVQKSSPPLATRRKSKWLLDLRNGLRELGELLKFFTRTPPQR
jgi:hypothetical protein